MNGMTTAVRYARTLYECAEEQADLPPVLAAMVLISRILTEVPAIREFCISARPSKTAGSTLVETAFAAYVDPLVMRTLRLIAENGRLGVIPLLPAAFDRVHAERTAVERVILETPHLAEADLLAEVTERMQRRLGKKVQLENRPNPSLIGGFRVLWRDRLLDNSVSGRLRAMQRCLTASI